MPRAREHAIGVPRRAAIGKPRAVELVVAKFAIGHRHDIDQHQPLDRVGDHRIVVDRFHRLFFIDLQQRHRRTIGIEHRIARGIVDGGRGHRPVAVGPDRLGGRQRHAGGILRLHMRVVPHRAERRGEDALGDALIGDRGDIVDAEAALPFGDEHVFAAQLQTADAIARAFVDIGELLEGLGFTAGIAIEGLAADPVLQFAIIVLDMHAPVIGIGVFVQVTAQHGLRFVPFGHAHRFEAGIEPDPGVQPDEIDEIGAEQQQLAHDRIVVVRRRQMAVGAGLGLGQPHRMREMRRERLARIARGRNRWLLHIDPLAVDIGRGQHQRAGRTDRRDLVALGGLVAAELEHLVARDLRIVGREIARFLGPVMVRLGFPVRLDRQMAPAAAGGP